MTLALSGSTVLFAVAAFLRHYVQRLLLLMLKAPVHPISSFSLEM
jgi:hypothetical protein